ncbi:MAG: tripartite tricarboxylate transporter substrate-binding protein [Ignavibacteriales bacterium]|nr:tripartite tricarboxylate transporter substrate-binding protein [Ignavibacteriales bacterium]
MVVQPARRRRGDRHQERARCPLRRLHPGRPGAVKDLGTYIITGTLNTKAQDWNIYLNSGNATVVSVTPNAPIKDFKEFLEMMKKDPKKVSVAVAGVPSAGHSAIEAIKLANGGDFKLVSYDGGNPAVIATVSGRDHRHHPAS